MKYRPLYFQRLIAILLLLISYQVQSQTLPVTATTIIGYPASLYLPDYYSTGSNKLTVNLVLNDFNEPLRDVYLNIKIESPGIKIQTKPGYRPANPITLYPGEIKIQSGADLEPYLNYNNILIEGITTTNLISRGGRLPEGMYTFCIEAYDFATRRLLSNTSCQVTHLAQNEPPSLLFPEKEAAVSPGASQNIMFQWLNNAPIEPTELVYKFTLYELIDPAADPMQAINNNQTIIVHEEELNTPIFNYNTAHPLLEEGKTYIYRVQSTTIDGKKIFKNDGYSEPSYFYYGFPGNGEITLIEPENNGALALTKEKVFSWGAPSKLLAGQTYTYEIKIAVVDSTKTYKEVLELDTLHFSEETSVQAGSMNYYMKVNKHFPTGTNFAWQVKAFTGEQEIAKSKIQTFGGPPCILDFIAADHYITVKYTDGCNLDNISGTGEVAYDEEGNMHEVEFNNVKIGREGVQYYLQEGEVLADASDLEPFKLTPDYERNEEAWFYPDSIKIDRYDYYFKGYIEWSFPHAVDQDEAPIIRTVTNWVKYEDFKLLGPLPLKDSIGFDLFDPLNFRIEFTEGSEFYIRGENSYVANFNGNILFPEMVTDIENAPIVFPFNNHEQLFNLSSNETDIYPKILIADKTTLTLQPSEFIMDLDDDASPQLFREDPLWRGFYINKGIYSFKGDYAYSKQFSATDELTVDYDFDTSDSIYAYIIHNGLWAKNKIDFENNNKLYFNTFPTKIDVFAIDIQKSATKGGYIDGEIAIPLLNDVDDFGFTSELTNFGFMPGYLHEELENKTFEYNAESEEEKLLLTFTRGFFADNNRLETTITIEWPYLKLVFADLPMFRIWGNYDIGFGATNAAYTLSRQMQTMLKGYEMTIDGIGAGRQGNAYAIGTTAKMVMAEDASGKDGPPVINFYSIVESSKIDEKYSLGSTSEYENVNTSTQGSITSANTSIGEVIEGKATIDDAEAVLDKYRRDMEQAEIQAQALIPRRNVGLAEPSDNLQRDFADQIPSQEVSEVVNDPASALTYQDLILIIDYISLFLDEEQKAKIQSFKELLVSFSPEEIAIIINKFTDIKGLLNKAIQEQVDNQILKVTKPLKQKVDGINTKITKTILDGTTTLVTSFEGAIDKPIDGFVKIAINAVNTSPLENKTPVINTINTVSTSVRESLKEELHRTVKASVHENIIREATGIIDTILYTGTVLYLTEALSGNVASLIVNSNFQLSDIDIDLEEMVEQNAAMLESRLTFEYFSDRVTLTIDDAISGFNWDAVKDSIIGDLLGGTVEAFIEEKVVNAVTDALGETAGGVVEGLAKNVSMDFDNIGQKLKDGDLSGIIKFDPTYIVVVTPVVDLSGYVKFTKDDPIWGDSFQAELNATIKKPITLSAYAKFINGTKPVVDVTGMSEEERRFIETYKYWFIELGVHGFSIPMTPIPIAITGFDGKVYHHMKRQEDRVTYYPNDSVRFGIGAGIYMVDAGSLGKIVAFDVGLELTLLKGGFEISLDGNAAIANVEASISKGGGGDSGGGSSGGGSTGGDSGDKKAVTLSRSLVLAQGFMSYNSIEKHFLASMRVDLNTAPLLCAGGGMKIDISPDWWQFAIGTRDDPLYIALLCKDSIFKGWFDINKEGLDIGLMTQLHLNLRSPWINLGVVKFQGWFVFDLDFQAELLVFWEPQFTIQRGYVFLEFYSGIGVDYQTPPLYQTKTFTIAAINLGGELEFATVPETYLRGEVHGAVTVCNITAGMSINADITF